MFNGNLDRFLNFPQLFFIKEKVNSLALVIAKETFEAKVTGADI